MLRNGDVVVHDGGQLCRQEFPIASHRGQNVVDVLMEKFSDLVQNIGLFLQKPVWSYAAASERLWNVYRY